MRYLRDHWRGALSLRLSLWLNGLLALIGFVLVAHLLAPFANQLPGSYNAALFAGAGMVLSTALVTWQVIGIRRALQRHESLQQVTNRRRGTIVRSLLILIVAGQGLSLAFHQAPALREGLELATVLEKIGHWRIALRNEGRDIEITGGVGAGIAEDFARVLDEAPMAQLVHLNLQHGGLISEALRLADLIRGRHLDTYTTDRCVSACTVVYLAGEKRYLRRDGQLGFHAYVAPGKGGSDAVQGQILSAAGVKADFIRRAMLTPHDDIWYPTSSELVAAQVVTDVVDGGDFASSGFGGAPMSDRELARQLTEIRLFGVLQEREPATFQEVLGITRQVVNAGQPINSARSLMAPVLERLRDKYLRYADDGAVNQLYQRMIQQAAAIAAADSALCYRHLMSPATSAADSARIKSILGGEGSDDFDTIADLIASADPGRAQPERADLVPLTQQVMRQVAMRHGAGLFKASFDGSITDPKQGCRIVLDFFQTILAMPPDASAKLLRSFARAG